LLQACRAVAATRRAQQSRLDERSLLVQVVPKVFADALRVLTDRAPFRPWAEMEALLAEELGAPTEQLFASVDPNPLAAASLAQVHRGVTRDGVDVAIKIQYPELRANLASDLAVFRSASPTPLTPREVNSNSLHRSRRRWAARCGRAAWT